MRNENEDAGLIPDRNCPGPNSLVFRIWRSDCSPIDNDLFRPDEALQIQLHTNPESMAEIAFRPEWVAVFAGDMKHKELVGGALEIQWVLPPFCTPVGCSIDGAE